MCLSVLILQHLIVYDVRMATIKKMREELAQAHRSGYTDEIRNISGIKGAPRDATEVMILYLALEAVRQPAGRDRQLAFAACQAVKKWNGTDSWTSAN